MVTKVISAPVPVSLMACQTEEKLAVVLPDELSCQILEGLTLHSLGILTNLIA